MLGMQQPQPMVPHQPPRTPTAIQLKPHSKWPTAELQDHPPHSRGKGQGHRPTIPTEDSHFISINCVHSYMNNHMKWSSLPENLNLLYANNKGASRPAWEHPCSLASTCYLFSRKYHNYSCYNAKLVSSWAGWLKPYLVANSENRFSQDEAQMSMGSG